MRPKNQTYCPHRPGARGLCQDLHCKPPRRSPKTSPAAPQPQHTHVTACAGVAAPPPNGTSSPDRRHGHKTLFWHQNSVKRFPLSSTGTWRRPKLLIPNGTVAAKPTARRRHTFSTRTKTLYKSCCTRYLQSPRARTHSAGSDAFCKSRRVSQLAARRSG